MQNDILASLSRLSDTDLVARLKGLLARECDVTTQVIAHLAELDTRDVFLREGYSSLFVYCRDALGLSEWEAYNRIEVARAARRFPVTLDMLASGAVNLTTVRLLAPNLTPAKSRRSRRSSPGCRRGRMSRPRFAGFRHPGPSLHRRRRRHPHQPSPRRTRSQSPSTPHACRFLRPP
ncbi:MAG: hypothetical protein DMF80_13200 [Acidobacteria bacterium]|nr:MAG: hypothetical protein DMF80_13200 [Acidobacteriota bacterium]